MRLQVTFDGLHFYLDCCKKNQNEVILSTLKTALTYYLTKILSNLGIKYYLYKFLIENDNKIIEKLCITCIIPPGTPLISPRSSKMYDIRDKTVSPVYYISGDAADSAVDLFSIKWV